jgi:hypothetical protein
MMEAIRSSETPVLTKNTRRKIPEDGFLHSHCRENLRPQILQVSSRFLCYTQICTLQWPWLYLKIEKDVMGGVCRAQGKDYKHKILVGRPEGTRPLGRIRRVREDNIKLQPWEIWYMNTEWIHLAQVRDRWWANVRTVISFRILKTVGNFLTSWVTARFPKSILIRVVKQILVL